MFSKSSRKADCAVLFSGGVDSTIAALNLIQKGKRVLLVTCHHDFLLNTSRSRIMEKRLAQRFGQERVSYRSVNVTRMFREVVLRPTLKDLLIHGGTFHCLGCKLCMHTVAIKICMEENIPCCTDGNVPGATYDQEPEIVDRFTEFYKDFGLKYIPFVVRERGLSNLFWEHEGRLEQKRRMLEIKILHPEESGPTKKYHFQPFCLNGQVNKLLNESFRKADIEKADGYLQAKRPLLLDYI